RELGRASALAAAIAVATLVVLAAVLVAVGHPRTGGRLDGSPGWRRFAAAVHLGVDRLHRHPASAVAMVATGLAYQVTVTLAAFCAARALGLDAVGLTATLAFFPAVAVVQVLPVTLGGLGMREWSLVLFLQPLGVQAGQAMALGFLVYGLNLLVSLAGAPSFALGGRRRHADGLVPAGPVTADEFAASADPGPHPTVERPR
ncbi:MAG: lysylphosphatidylglycerol synthase domain-containing protein, partial [Acidimicrobiia bacterium]